MTLLGAATMAPLGAAAQEAPEPGKGNAYAQGVKIDPQSGQLSFGITYGQALAGHQNTQAIGESRSLDLGVIGVTLAGEGCDGGEPTLPEEQQPQPLVSRTDEGGGPKTKEEHGVQRSVNASTSPLATANAVVGGLPTGLPFVIGASDSNVMSGVVDGRRTARAVSEVADFSIPGVLEIVGMKWVAEYQTEPEEMVVTEFSIEGINVADTRLLGQVNSLLGGAIPLLSYEEPIDEIGEINSLLEPLGISLHPPRQFVESGIAFVQPLKIRIAPAGEAITAIFDALQPIRAELTKALFELDCSTASIITIADVVLGSVSGAGSLNLELGGVTATTGDIDVFRFGGLPVPSLPPVLPSPPPSFSSPSLPDSGFTGGSGSIAPPATSAPQEEVAAVDTEPVASSLPFGERGGPLLGVGLGVLALLGALAEGDRRKMRKAQRSVPIAMTSDGGAG